MNYITHKIYTTVSPEEVFWALACERCGRHGSTGSWPRGVYQDRLALLSQNGNGSGVQSWNIIVLNLVSTFKDHNMKIKTVSGGAGTWASYMNVLGLRMAWGTD